MADNKVSADDTELDENGKPVVTPQEDKTAPNESEEDKGEGDEASSSENKNADTAKESEEEVEPVPVRKSAQQHIIARQKRVIEKLRSKTEEEDNYQSAEEDEDNSLDPEMKTAVDKSVQKHLKPLLGTLASNADEDELKTLFSQEPGAKKYEKRIRARMEVWKNVPPQEIYQGLAFQDAQKIGAKRRKVADVEAEQVRNTGSTRRGAAKTSNIPTPEEMDDMDDTAFEELQHKARTGAFVSK